MKTNLEEWMTEELKRGYEVNFLFPNSYDGSGLGYEISMLQGTEQYLILLKRKTFDAPITISKILKARWWSMEHEEIIMEGLIGKELVLTPKKVKRYGYEFNQLAMTGTLILKAEPP